MKACFFNIQTVKNIKNIIAKSKPNLYSTVISMFH